VHEAVQGGVGAAHRYAKPLEAIRIATVADEDGTPTACPAALLTADHAKWMGVWGASSAPPQSLCGADQLARTAEEESDHAVQRWLDAAPTEQLPPLTAEEVRSTALGFKLRTSTPDGWHPRHIALLPQALLGTLVELYAALLASENYVLKRQSLKLLSEFLLERENFKIMMRYIADGDFDREVAKETATPTP
jgi:hypothetical protein